MSKYLLQLAVALLSLNAYATDNMYVGGVKIKLFAQSEHESTAHFIETDKSIYPGGPDGKHPWCGGADGNRLL